MKPTTYEDLFDCWPVGTTEQQKKISRDVDEWMNEEPFEEVIEVRPERQVLVTYKEEEWDEYMGFGTWDIISNVPEDRETSCCNSPEILRFSDGQIYCLACSQWMDELENPAFCVDDDSEVIKYIDDFRREHGRYAATWNHKIGSYSYDIMLRGAGAAAQREREEIRRKTTGDMCD